MHSASAVYAKTIHKGAASERNTKGCETYIRRIIIITIIVIARYLRVYIIILLGTQLLSVCVCVCGTRKTNYQTHARPPRLIKPFKDFTGPEHATINRYSCY